MTPKQTALKAVARLVGVSVGYALAIALLIQFVPMPILGILVVLGVVFYLLKMLYDMELDKAEQLSKLVDNSKE